MKWHKIIFNLMTTNISFFEGVMTIIMLLITVIGFLIYLLLT